MAITVCAIDISLGGVGIKGPLDPLHKWDYEIVVITSGGEEVRLSARLVRQNSESAGFKLTRIDELSLQVIKRLVDQYQTTDAYIIQLDEHNILQQQFIDDDGRELEISFDLE